MSIHDYDQIHFLFKRLGEYLNVLFNNYQHFHYVKNETVKSFKKYFNDYLMNAALFRDLLTLTKEQITAKMKELYQQYFFFCSVLLRFKSGVLLLEQDEALTPTEFVDKWSLNLLLPDRQTTNEKEILRYYRHIGTIQEEEPSDVDIANFLMLFNEESLSKELGKLIDLSSTTTKSTKLNKQETKRHEAQKDNLILLSNIVAVNLRTFMEEIYQVLNQFVDFVKVEFEKYGGKLVLASDTFFNCGKLKQIQAIEFNLPNEEPFTLLFVNKLECPLNETMKKIKNSTSTIPISKTKFGIGSNKNVSFFDERKDTEEEINVVIINDEHVKNDGDLHYCEKLTTSTEDLKKALHECYIVLENSYGCNENTDVPIALQIHSEYDVSQRKAQDLHVQLWDIVKLWKTDHSNPELHRLLVKLLMSLNVQLYMPFDKNHSGKNFGKGYCFFGAIYQSNKYWFHRDDYPSIEEANIAYNDNSLCKKDNVVKFKLFLDATIANNTVEYNTVTGSKRTHDQTENISPISDIISIVTAALETESKKRNLKTKGVNSLGADCFVDAHNVTRVSKELARISFFSGANISYYGSNTKETINDTLRERFGFLDRNINFGALTCSNVVNDEKHRFGWSLSEIVVVFFDSLFYAIDMAHYYPMRRVCLNDESDINELKIAIRSLFSKLLEFYMEQFEQQEENRKLISEEFIDLLRKELELAEEEEETIVNVEADNNRCHFINDLSKDILSLSSSLSTADSLEEGGGEEEDINSTVVSSATNIVAESPQPPDELEELLMEDNSPDLLEKNNEKEEETEKLFVKECKSFMSSTMKERSIATTSNLTKVLGILKTIPPSFQTIPPSYDPEEDHNNSSFGSFARGSFLSVVMNEVLSSVQQDDRIQKSFLTYLNHRINHGNDEDADFPIHSALNIVGYIIKYNYFRLAQDYYDVHPYEQFVDNSIVFAELSTFASTNPQDFAIPPSYEVDCPEGDTRCQRSTVLYNQQVLQQLSLQHLERNMLRRLTGFTFPEPIKKAIEGRIGKALSSVGGKLLAVMESILDDNKIIIQFSSADNTAQLQQDGVKNQSEVESFMVKNCKILSDAIACWGNKSFRKVKRSVEQTIKSTEEMTETSKRRSRRPETPINRFSQSFAKQSKTPKQKTSNEIREDEMESSVVCHLLESPKKTIAELTTLVMTTTIPPPVEETAEVDNNTTVLESVVCQLLESPKQTIAESKLLKAVDNDTVNMRCLSEKQRDLIKELEEKVLLCLGDMIGTDKTTTMSQLTRERIRLMFNICLKDLAVLMVNDGVLLVNNNKN